MFCCLVSRMTSKHLTQLVVTSVLHMSCNLIELLMIFCNGTGAIFSGVSAFWSGGKTFLSEEHLKKFANAYSISKNYLKHETLLAKEFSSERVAAAYISRTIYFNYSSLGALDFLYKLFLIAVTLPVISASCERMFSKMKLVKTSLRNSMTSERLNSNALLSTERVRAEK